jgi:hypothetical protein
MVVQRKKIRKGIYVENKKSGVHHVWGIILRDVDKNKWEVKTSDGRIIEFSSQQLRIVDQDGSHPPEGKDPIIVSDTTTATSTATSSITGDGTITLPLPPPPPPPPANSINNNPTPTPLATDSSTADESATTTSDLPTDVTAESTSVASGNAIEEPESTDMEEDMTLATVIEAEHAEFMESPHDEVELDQYEQRRMVSSIEKEELIQSGHTVTVGNPSTTGEYTWKVVRESFPSDVNSDRDHDAIGLKGVDFNLLVETWDEWSHKEEEASELGATKASTNDPPTPFLEVFMALEALPAHVCVANINRRLEDLNKRSKVQKKRIIKMVTLKEWWHFRAIRISTGATKLGGISRVFQQSGGKNISITKCIADILKQDFPLFEISRNRFQDLTALYPYAFIGPETTTRVWNGAQDPWYPIIDHVNGYNTNRTLRIAASKEKTVDETMSPFMPQTTKRGGLPHLSFVKRKPKPLGSEFKTVACAKTGVMLHLEIQRGKEPMKHCKFVNELAATAACTLRLGLATKHCGQLSNDDTPKDVFYGDSWFASVKTAVAMWEKVSCSLDVLLCF